MGDTTSHNPITILIECPACAHQYHVPAESVPSSSASRFHCGACDHVFESRPENSQFESSSDNQPADSVQAFPEPASFSSYDHPLDSPQNSPLNIVSIEEPEPYPQTASSTKQTEFEEIVSDDLPLEEKTPVQDILEEAASAIDPLYMTQKLSDNQMKELQQKLSSLKDDATGISSELVSDFPTVSATPAPSSLPIHENHPEARPTPLLSSVAERTNVQDESFDDDLRHWTDQLADQHSDDEADSIPAFMSKQKHDPNSDAAKSFTDDGVPEQTSANYDTELSGSGSPELRSEHSSVSLAQDPNRFGSRKHSPISSDSSPSNISFSGPVQPFSGTQMSFDLPHPDPNLEAEPTGKDTSKETNLLTPKRVMHDTISSSDSFEESLEQEMQDDDFYSDTTAWDSPEDEERCEVHDDNPDPTLVNDWSDERDLPSHAEILDFEDQFATVELGSSMAQGVRPEDFKVPLDRPESRARSFLVLVVPMFLFLVFLFGLGELMRSEHPYVRSILALSDGSGIQVAPAGLRIKSPEFRKVPLANGDLIHVISGQLHNTTDRTIRKITLEGSLFDENGKTLLSVKQLTGSGLENAKLDELSAQLIRDLQKTQATSPSLSPGEKRKFALPLLSGSRAEARFFTARVFSVEY